LSTLFFFVSLIDYDKECYEDWEMNRMQESLKLWETTINSERARENPVALVMTMHDLLADKLKKIPLSNYYPEYDGGSNVEKAKRFIAQQFLNKIQVRKSVHIMFVNNLDKSQVTSSILSEITDNTSLYKETVGESAYKKTNQVQYCDLVFN
jgi:guanine nucleotide-binding protein subunit alpha